MRNFVEATTPPNPMSNMSTGQIHFQLELVLDRQHAYDLNFQLYIYQAMMTVTEPILF